MTLITYTGIQIVEKFSFFVIWPCFSADEILNANMKLEKLESDLNNRTAKYNAIQNEVIGV